MKQLVEWLEKINAELDKADGKRIVRGGADTRDLDELADKMLRRFGEKVRKEGLL